MLERLWLIINRFKYLCLIELRLYDIRSLVDWVNFVQELANPKKKKKEKQQKRVIAAIY